MANPATDIHPVNTAHVDDIAVITVNKPPVNALTHMVRRALGNAFQALKGDPSIRSVVIACAGRTFVAGADISEQRDFPKWRNKYGSHGRDWYTTQRR
jgi:3-hydroxyacyl-CoA dehydrogenase